MKKNSIRNFVCQLRNLSSRKQFFFKVNYSKMNSFLASFLTKEGFLRGFFLIESENKKKSKIYIILKYDEKEKSCFNFIKKKNILSNKFQFVSKKNLTKYCNGLGLILVYTITGFISNEIAFWLKLGGKKVLEIK